MANYRSIHTKFWCDPKMESMSADAKYLMLYLITNEHRNESGLYALSINKMSSETSLPMKKVESALSELSKSKRVVYDPEECFVWIVNAVKHTPMSPNCINSIANDLQHCSSRLLVGMFCEFYANHLSLQQVIKGFTENSKGFYEPPNRVQGTGYKDKEQGEAVEVEKPPKLNLREIFEKAWSAYPSRKGRKEAERHFYASVKTQEDVDNLRVAMGNYLKSETYKKGYIQNGSTWFNNWRDWIVNPEPKKADPIADALKPTVKTCEKCGGQFQNDVLCPKCYPPNPHTAEKIAETFGPLAGKYKSTRKDDVFPNH